MVSAMPIRENLQALMEKAEISAYALADKTGVPQPTISRILKGESNDPKTGTLEPLAAYFSVTVSELRDADLTQRRPGQEPKPFGERVPVVGTAQLGDLGFYLEMEYPVGHGDGWVVYPTKDRNAYCVRCKGDSMRPRVKPGEFVVIEPNHAINPGDEVLVKLKDGRVMVKVFNFARDGTVELSSVNEKHPPITVDRSTVEVIHYMAGIVKESLYYRDI
jgi:phage repressor protein C with HTH and peptisase S24 domain